MTTRPLCTFRLPLAAFALAMLGLLTVLATPAQAQTFGVLYDFTGGADGASPNGVTIGGPGLLYGTTFEGGTHNWGTVFKLAHRGSGWTASPLYEFTDGNDGGQPLAGVTLGPNGALYGTTFQGGIENQGTVFEVQPPPRACNTAICYWNETVIHLFSGEGDDGFYPFYGILSFDQAGNLYGTTLDGGAYDYGEVFELSPSSGGWSFSAPVSFQYSNNGAWSPYYGVIIDPAGNLYGTTWYGGTAEAGTVYEASPSGGTWTENTLYSFPSINGESAQPTALIMDQSGNLYGTAWSTGGASRGSVFELTPSNGGWTYSTLYGFPEACAPEPVAMDSAGHIYGNCILGGAYGFGYIFELTNSSGSWTITDLHDFTGQTDGGGPSGPVVVDSSGNVYGGTAIGGNLSDCQGYDTDGCGVIWEITP